MSSTAAAPLRTAENEPQNRRQVRFLADTEEPVLQDDSADGAAQPLDEVTRVERLLSQLEARSMALVPYNYGTLREPPAKNANTTLIAGVLVAIWLSTVVLAIVYIRYNRPGPAGDRVSTATPFLITGEPDPQEQKVARSVDHLAKALVSSSERMDQLQATMERSNRDWQRLATKASDHPKGGAAAAKTEATDATPGRIPDVAAMPRNWHKILEIKPTESAVPHKSDDGTIDYWLVPRGAEQVQTKVLPIGTSPEGVVIHNLEDGKDYTLTPAGEWRNGAIVPVGN